MTLGCLRPTNRTRSHTGMKPKCKPFSRLTRLQRFWVDVVPSVPTLWICITDGTQPALHVLSISLLCRAFCLSSRKYPLGHRVFNHEPRPRLTGGIFSTFHSSGGCSKIAQLPCYLGYHHFSRLAEEMLCKH